MVDTNSGNLQNDFNEALRQFLDAHMRGEKPDMDEFIKKFPEFEDQIRQKIHSLQKINSLFDTILQTDKSEFGDTASGFDLVGRKIGHYEICEMIGRGGMGVVYLARDTKLDRSVAIKSMPSELQANSTARTRLTREAKLLASLSHPNIAVIHEITEEEGASYLVLEYVPGETLAERITKGPLKLQEALTMALQIAEAVAAAHEHDVIHRDLKPGNIKITPDSRVKVLDFGLAKALGGEPSKKPITVTQPDHVMGTPAYMSPEQVRGNPIDKRSDIWSFGCIMYQMLTGRLPFVGETATDTLVHIIERQPDWELLPKETPSNIRTLLRRCLEKDQRRRLRDIGDAGIEIDETLTSPTVNVPTIKKMRPTGLRRLIAWAAACLILIVIATSLITLNLKRTPPLSQPARRFTIHPETDLAQHALYHHTLALSPDGRRLAYVEVGSDVRRKIYLRELDKFKAKPLPGTEGAVSPFFSPDGQWIGYFDHYQRKLKKVSVKGGKPMILCDSMQFRGGSWGTDDTIIFTPGRSSDEEGGLWRISASGEGLEQLTVFDPNQGERGHLWPQILPGGKAVLFTNVHKGTLENQFEVYSLETGKRHVLFKRGTYARYVPTGHIVYAHKRALYAVRFDIERLKVVGSSVPIIPGVLTGGSGSAHFAISQNGSLAYVPVVTRITERTPVWVDREGRIEPLPAATPRNYLSVTISPDGTQLAFGIMDADNVDVWIYDLTQHTLTPLTSDGISSFPIWTPDGKGVVFQSYQDGKFQLFRQNVTGGEPELLATFEGIFKRLSCCSPDGKEVLVNRWDYDPNHPRWDNDIYVVPLEQNEKYHLRPFIQRYHNQRMGAWSPDGRWVAYTGDESGRWEVYVEPYPGPGPKTMISNQGGYQPAWSRDGKELFYRSGHGNRKIIAATFETEPDFRITHVEELFEEQYQLYTTWRNYDVAPDGRFLMIQESQEPTPPVINVVLNWFEELKRLVPTGNTNR